MFKKFIIKIIEVYQKTLSPEHGIIKYIFPVSPTCRFYPTCSEYTKKSIEKYGIILGTTLGLKRLIRCHPGTKGGLDPVL